MRIRHLNLEYPFEKRREVLLHELYLDIPSYNFNPDEWQIDLSQSIDEGHDFVVSEILVVNKKTKERFEGWSDYIATSDGKEIYIFFDILCFDEKEPQKYCVTEKNNFGVPSHIQKNFSGKLKQEILKDKIFGSMSFYKSIYLQETLQQALQRRSNYYTDALDFLKRARSSKMTQEELEPYFAANEWMEKERESWIATGKKDFIFFNSDDGKRFIKFDQSTAKFILVNEQKEILEYWIFPEGELWEYVEREGFVRIPQVEFERVVNS